ncbi:UDP-N-acetylmuramate:L-alanyl-gamma-D-glutamyl-meso-diaminopimelate ligase [Sinimarinibacterium flocculans]|uniref:UDP-N-acetylmuramate--L-alanyl-gamma-D-glutamyl-meso-2,6-diaminoheptandioate ligase n=1 Tax=Sinimarinibacterium flocculans TaxID=985250 RepID=A0A318EG98_9GAMM|nr:UDP-N-acetylmuramate:L-alanyl-gamma-D-glutamyl-meso-diaminopimelate ligase [Sinimarinibacterium flocculans]MEC9362488.1 UDP-N-acetylmuramate:L-alanyl-gamma-D-glutamyl-meso-diaminopimelate ligase [Pseudomonadota bacterium]PXV69568.1 UDP-N-acetylmuramate: L-alanyl-gamma-D-glutamyl-meso-diaminopimelate ligase [Sinimarinibacterium flocculans]
MHLHILGICGTFMAGIAAIAREAGHRVTGSDANAWPPMSTQLEALGIEVMRGYAPAHLDPAPDIVVVGNVVTRGNPAMEHVLDAGLPYTSGPQWLAENVLQGRHVLAVAGTHGKTTTSALLAWLLEHAGLAPGFLIGGVPQNFGISARLGRSRYFVIEADEYDTAFFDKRSKFVHYRPRTCILNNLEYDHADIFPDLASIERQFHHLVRTVPGSGRLVVNGADADLARVLAAGCWSERVAFNEPGGWEAEPAEGGWTLRVRGHDHGVVASPLAGRHNRDNALAAFAAADHVGVPVPTLVEGLAAFRNVRRRLEVVGSARGVTVYDDFAHHPTAIAVTVDALRTQRQGRILAVLEPRSNTMRLGTHASGLAASLRDADLCFVYARPDLKWDAAQALARLGPRLSVHADLDSLVAAIAAAARDQDRVLVMSNGDFGGVHGRILRALVDSASAAVDDPRKA